MVFPAEVNRVAVEDVQALQLALLRCVVNGSRSKVVLLQPGGQRVVQ